MARLVLDDPSGGILRACFLPLEIADYLQDFSPSESRLESASLLGRARASRSSPSTKSRAMRLPAMPRGKSDRGRGAADARGGLRTGRAVRRRAIRRADGLMGRPALAGRGVQPMSSITPGAWAGPLHGFLETMPPFTVTLERFGGRQGDIGQTRQRWRAVLRSIEPQPRAQRFVTNVATGSLSAPTRPDTII